MLERISFGKDKDKVVPQIVEEVSDEDQDKEDDKQLLVENKVSFAFGAALQDRQRQTMKSSRKSILIT